MTISKTLKTAARALQSGNATAVKAALADVKAAATDVKTLAILKKIAKKTKIGVYDPFEIVEALNTVDPGWEIEPLVIAAPLGGYGLHDIGRHLLEQMFPNGEKELYVSGALKKSEPFSLTYQGETKKALDPKAVEVLAEVVRKKIKVIPKAKKGQAANHAVENGGLYATRIVVEADDYHWRGEGEHENSVNIYDLAMGMPAIKITAPNKEHFLIPVKPLLKRAFPRNRQYKDEENPITLQPGNAKEREENLFGWLYKTVPDISTKAQQVVDSPEAGVTEAEHKLKQRIGEEAGSLGTCPVCDRIQKLNLKVGLGHRHRSKQKEHPLMVLHGYKRPGDGWIYGDCFGVGYPPYELSTEGCEAWATKLKTEYIPRKKESIAHIKTLKSVKGYVAIKQHKFTYRGEGTTYQEAIVHTSGKIELEDKVLTNDEFSARFKGVPSLPAIFTFIRPEGDSTPLEGKEAAAMAKDYIKGLLNDAERDLAGMERELKYTEEKITKWKPQPLPGTKGVVDQV
jgi:hypothetical protein